MQRLKVYAKRSQELREALTEKYAKETQRIFEARLASKFQLAFNAGSVTMSPRLPLQAEPPTRGTFLRRKKNQNKTKKTPSKTQSGLTDPNRNNALPEHTDHEIITLRFSSMLVGILIS